MCVCMCMQEMLCLTVNSRQIVLAVFSDIWFQIVVCYVFLTNLMYLKAGESTSWRIGRRVFFLSECFIMPTVFFIVLSNVFLDSYKKRNLRIWNTDRKEKQ